MLWHGVKRLEGRMCGARLLCSLAVMTLCGYTGAESALAGEAGAAMAARATHPIWIQDPWSGANQLTRVRAPSTELWNAARIDDYEAAVQVQAAPALGVLTISRLNIQAPIYNGTDEFNLDRGLGRILGMARPEEEGNLGISGHRDGYFRVLKDIRQGDTVMVRSPGGIEVYEVHDVSIVDKHDESLLEPTEQKKLTLVTCYPFYYVGNAPQRFIVHAYPVDFAGD